MLPFGRSESSTAWPALPGSEPREQLRPVLTRPAYSPKHRLGTCTTQFIGSAASKARRFSRFAGPLVWHAGCVSNSELGLAHRVK
jgi:hypothetical protein